MKKNEKKVLPFPPSPPQTGVTTIIVEVGDERFAIHFEIEDLPPAHSIPPPPLLLLERPPKK